MYAKVNLPFFSHNFQILHLLLFCIGEFASFAWEWRPRDITAHDGEDYQPHAGFFFRVDGFQGANVEVGRAPPMGIPRNCRFSWRLSH